MLKIYSNVFKIHKNNKIRNNKIHKNNLICVPTVHVLNILMLTAIETYKLYFIRRKGEFPMRTSPGKRGKENKGFLQNCKV